ncbi:N-acetylglucosaminyl deacetylase, LmbE family [Candidatus Methylobacter favarea]|uniref:N-acetylglucosaminyl deacetylase, LmbE family n=1 Tax=Candidatus Methylobacter favarea TaxID=2707345 RepID=A0A8S0W9Y0_9GAMM|nr:PIG-L family deacetylase [Candidatus Methylobacter favarea]CAA9890316.1 N-acetylglucosaminyl deacetylase, LmbE family [Candidatus Methylobacter favarea]
MKRFIDRWRQRRIAELALCPLPKILIPLENGKVLVFAPHQDDETIGCGGTLALLRKKGCEIRAVFVTDGGGAGGLPEGAAAIRKKEAIAALASLGIGDYVFLDEPDGSFGNTPEFEQKIMAILEKFNPDWLFLPSMLDYHRDHVAISQAVFCCWRQWQGAARAFFYEIWSPLPATCVVDISSVAELKRAALSFYKLPLAQCDYLAASMGLAAYRGLYLSRKGCAKFAEAFVEAEKNKSWRGMAERMFSLRIYVEKLLKQ